MNKAVTYIAGEGNPETGLWQDLHEFRFQLSPGEFTLIWAAIQIRAKALKIAETNFQNYNHPEPFNIGGIKKTVEIGSAVEILEGKLLVTCDGTGQSEKLIKTLQKGEKTGYTWRLTEEAGLQAMASIGWFCDMVKARQPPITKATNDVVYLEDLMPTNTTVKKTEDPSGYNKKQITLMDSAVELMKLVLDPIPEIRSGWIGVPTVIFGQRIFKTTSKVFNSLPDLEEEERKKFDEMKAMAKAAAAAANNNGGGE